MQSTIVEKAQKYVSELLKTLSEDYRYHNVAHTFSVVEATQLLGKQYGLSDDELEILALSALFHDVGFVKTFDNHEDASKKIANKFLKEKAYPPEKIEQIQSLIEITRLGQVPETLLEKILKDADFNNLKNGSYYEKGLALRYEWKVFRKRKMKEDEWLWNSYNFWSNHQFYTEKGEALFGPEKQETILFFKTKLGFKEKKKKEVNPDEEGLLAGTRSGQMMFKTSLRNHIDLTNIADSKASMMLSINALIITITMPMLATNVQGNAFLLIPTAILLTTCIISIIYAALATRPIKTTGETNLDNIKTGVTNLFFFGNFYKMGISEYKTGLKMVIADEKVLDDTVMADLYFLGRALGVKYNRLRICYGVFMIGMTLTVVAFALGFVFLKQQG